MRRRYLYPLRHTPQDADDNEETAAAAAADEWLVRAAALARAAPGPNFGLLCEILRGTQARLFECSSQGGAVAWSIEAALPGDLNLGSFGPCRAYLGLSLGVAGQAPCWEAGLAQAGMEAERRGCMGGGWLQRWAFAKAQDKEIAVLLQASLRTACLVQGR